MASLRIFQISLENSELKTTLHADLEVALNNLNIKEKSIFFHIGSSRPDNETILKLFNIFPDRVIVSEAAKVIFKDINSSVNFTNEKYIENLIIFLIGDDVSFDSFNQEKSFDNDFENLSVRTKNALKKNGIHTIKNLIDFVRIYSFERLLKFDGFGVNSLDEIKKIIFFNVTNSNDDERIIIKKKTKNFIEALSKESFIKFKESIEKGFDDEKMRYVAINRLALDGSQLTLEQIAKKYNVTRERIRQIETQVKKIIFTHSNNISAFIDERISLLRESLQRPLTFNNLKIQDDWFLGINSKVTLEELLAINYDPVNSVNDFENQVIISCTGKNSLKESMDIIIDKLFSENIDNKDDIEKIVKLHIPTRASELRGWASKYLIDNYFSLNAVTSKLVINSSDRINTKTSSVGSIIINSPEPIHKKEILRQIVKLDPTITKLRQIETVLMHTKNTYLYAPSTYGTIDHLGLSNNEINEISDDCINLIYEINPNKQWGQKELLKLLQKSSSKALFKNLDQYKLGIVLKIDGKLKPLGRGAFVLPEMTDIANKKIDKSELLIDILESSSTPLSANNIKEKLELIAPSAGTYQIHDQGRILAVRTSQEHSRENRTIHRLNFGLIDKHFNISPEMHFKVIQETLKLFFDKDKLSFNEIKDQIFYDDLLRRFYEQPYLLFALCNRSVFFIVDNNFIYLTSKFNSKVNGQYDAAKLAAIKINEKGISDDDMFVEIESIYGDKVVKGVIRKHLSNMEFTRHEDEKRWYWDNKIKYD